MGPILGGSLVVHFQGFPDPKKRMGCCHIMTRGTSSRDKFDVPLILDVSSVITTRLVSSQKCVLSSDQFDP